MNKIIIALTALIAVALAAPLKGDSSILAEWEAFKTTYNKHYTEPEENFRYNIYLASKEGVETNNKLFRNGLVNSEQSLDQWADATLKEIAIALRADEWSKYKETYGKNYADPKEDEYRRTLYYRHKQEFEDQNLLVNKGFSTWSKGINQFSDQTNNESPTVGSFVEINFRTGPVPIGFAGISRPKRHQTGKLPKNYHSYHEEQHTGAIINPHNGHHGNAESHHLDNQNHHAQENHHNQHYAHWSPYGADSKH